MWTIQNLMCLTRKKEHKNWVKESTKEVRELPLCFTHLFAGLFGELPDFNEAPADGQSRFVSTVKAIYTNLYPTKNVLIVGHGDSLNAVGYSLKPGVVIYDTEECCFLVFDPANNKLVSHSRLAICEDEL